MMMVLSRFDKEELHSFRHNMEKTVCSMILQSGDGAKEIARRALQILHEDAVSAEDEIDVDMRFHFALVEGTGNRLMISLMQSVSEIYTDMISQVLSSADDEKKSRLFKAHEEIAKALEAGDEAKCFKAIDEHYNMIELEISLNKKNADTINEIKNFILEKNVEITQMDMSTYEEDNKIKIVGKDKRKSEHSLVPELIEFENVVQVQQI